MCPSEVDLHAIESIRRGEGKYATLDNGRTVGEWCTYAFAAIMRHRGNKSVYEKHAKIANVSGKRRTRTKKKSADV